MTLLALALDAGFAAWNGYLYSQSHHVLNLIAAVICGVFALYVLVSEAK